MIINHNITALNTHNKLSAASGAQSKSMEKLASGLRINKAGDDAAGLAISEKMRGQIRGLDQASRNSQDSISLLQTAEGALNETHDILQRVRELSVQSANDTNTSDDRAEIQKEYVQLRDEVNRIATTTEFNTKKLLNGDAGNKVTFSTNTNLEGASASVDSIVAGSYAVQTTTAAERATVTGGSAVVDGDVTTGGAKSVTINGTAINFNATAGDAAATRASFVTAVNNANIGVVASDAAGTLSLNSDDFGSSEAVSVTANADSAMLKLTTDASTDSTDTGVDVAGTIDGVTATGVGRTLTATSGDAVGLKVTLTGASASAATGAKGSVDVTKNELTSHIGANQGQVMSINIGSMGATDLGIHNLDLNSQSGAEAAITALDAATKQVSGERSKLGSYQNRLEHTINNLKTSSENLTAAESRIRDVDMAKEMMNQTKNSILAQAAQAMLAQSNQTPQGVLQLLR